MAKRIKAIKCPSCGGTKATELRADYYRCDSCGTPFFLDSDDITIHHKHYTASGTNIFTQKNKIIVIGFLAFIIVMIFIFQFGSSPSSDRSYVAPTVAETEETPKEPSKSYEWESEKVTVFKDDKNTPIYIVVGKLDPVEDAIDRKDSLFFGVYDVKTGSQLLFDRFDGSSSDSYPTMKFQRYEDDNLYLTIDKSQIYRFNKQSLRFNSLRKQLETEVPEFKDGIAQVELADPEFDGAAFKVLANDGGKHLYFPMAKRVYDPEKMWDITAKHYAEDVSTTEYSFSRESSEFPKEKIQLIKYKFQHRKGYPRDKHVFSWRKDYGRSGIFTERSPYKKRLITDYAKQRGKITSIDDFTPGRNYFSPSVVVFNDKEVIIRFRPTANPNDKLILQCLDANTAEIKWTLQDLGRIEDMIILDDGYVLLSDNKPIFISTDAKTQVQKPSIPITLTLN